MKNLINKLNEVAGESKRGAYVWLKFRMCDYDYYSLMEEVVWDGRFSDDSLVVLDVVKSGEPVPDYWPA